MAAGRGHLSSPPSGGGCLKRVAPSNDALQILVRQGASTPTLSRMQMPEFILYWRDRGDVSSTWDSKFIQHVRRQWQFYTGMMEQDSMPRAMSAQLAAQRICV